MTTIQLTDQQLQTLQSEHCQRIEVVDPATSKHYVLVAREVYDRVRPLLEEQIVKKGTLGIPYWDTALARSILA